SEKGKVIRIPKFTHGLLIGPTGSGKDVSICVPVLRTWFEGSIFALDIKGDLFKHTAAVRQGRGQRVVRLAAFTGGTDGFNPLDCIGNGPTLVDDARALASSMVDSAENVRDPHWNARSVMVLTAALVFVLLEVKAPQRTLNSVMDIVSDSN